MPILMLLMNICILFILWFGAKSIAQGGAQVGDVVSVINYATRITGALSVLPFLIMVFSRAKASGKESARCWKQKAARERGRTRHGRLQAGLSFAKCPSAIRAWKRRAASSVLSASPKETVAIMGATGSGKSTLFQLIPRLYTADSGSIFIDGKPIGEFSACGLRRKSAMFRRKCFCFRAPSVKISPGAGGCFTR